MLTVRYTLTPQCVYFANIPQAKQQPLSLPIKLINILRFQFFSCLLAVQGFTAFQPLSDCSQVPFTLSTEIRFLVAFLIFCVESRESLVVAMNK